MAKVGAERLKIFISILKSGSCGCNEGFCKGAASDDSVPLRLATATLLRLVWVMMQENLLRISKRSVRAVGRRSFAASTTTHKTLQAFLSASTAGDKPPPRWMAFFQRPGTEILFAYTEFAASCAFKCYLCLVSF